MKPVHFFLSKSVLTLVIGFILVVTPDTIFRLLGAEGNAMAVLFTRLFGLLAVAAGIALFLNRREQMNKTEALNYVVWDIFAIVLIAGSTSAGTVNQFGYLLAAIYGISAIGFTFCALSGGLTKN